MVSTTRPCEILRIDLFGPMRIKNIRGKSYTLVIVDDFSRYIGWFFEGKSEAFQTILKVLQDT